jgi:hypothetical protein
MSATQTQVIFESQPSASSQTTAKAPFQTHEAINLGRIPSTSSRLDDEQDVRNELPPPSTAVDALERWNSPPRNKWALFSTYLSFLILGLNDASPGVGLTYSQANSRR